MDAQEHRWIRARVVVKIDRRNTRIFTDVGPRELVKLKSKYKDIEIEDWGRYSEPRNEADREEKKRMKEILR